MPIVEDYAAIRAAQAALAAKPPLATTLDTISGPLLDECAVYYGLCRGLEENDATLRLRIQDFQDNCGA